MASQDYSEELLKVWFPDANGSSQQKPLIEKDIQKISAILSRTSQSTWSRVPRIYTLLRLMNQLYAIDSFIDNGITDFSLPFSLRGLPEGLRSQTARATFIDNQHLVCNSKALELERTDAPHGRFRNPDNIPLKTI